jgi:hypothetical protein
MNAFGWNENAGANDAANNDHNTPEQANFWLQGNIITAILIVLIGKKLFFFFKFFKI